MLAGVPRLVKGNSGMGTRRSLLMTGLALAGGACLLMAPGLAAKQGDTGGLDPSFGTGGRASVAVETSGSIQVNGLAPAGNGSSVLSFLDSDSDAGAVVRFSSRGALDRKFGVDGVARLSFDSASLQPRDVLVGGNHRVFVTGESKRTGKDQYTGGLAALNPDGTPDTRFAGDGIALPESLDAFTPYEMDFSPGGKIVAVGIQGGTPSSNTTVARYLPDGRLDHSFSGDGLLVLKVHQNQLGRTVDVDRRGRIVIGNPGEVAPYSPQSRQGDYDLVRVLPDGHLDSTFGSDGRVTVNPTEYDDEITDVKVDGRGGILVAGGSNANHGSLVRLGPSGRIDRNFGRKGVNEMSWFTPQGIVTDRKGRIFPIGFTSTGNSDEMGGVQRIGPRGGLDARFAGWHTGTRYLTDGFVDSRGRVLAGGNLDSREAAVLRLKP